MAPEKNKVPMVPIKLWSFTIFCIFKYITYVAHLFMVKVHKALCCVGTWVGSRHITCKNVTEVSNVSQDYNSLLHSLHVENPLTSGTFIVIIMDWSSNWSHRSVGIMLWCLHHPVTILIATTYLPIPSYSLVCGFTCKLCR